MFNWLKNVFTRSLENPAVPASSPMAYEYLGGRRATSGVAVDRNSVLGYPAVWRCINLISHKVGRLPLNVYKRNKDGGREIDPEHPAEWLLAKRPNDLCTPFTFKSTMQAHALLHGNAYAWIQRDSNAKPIELLILNPETTFPVMDNGQLIYAIRLGQVTRKILPENVFHLRGLSHDGIVGYSVIDILREAFGLGLAAQRYGAVYFRNNGSPGPTILKMPQFLKDKDALKRFRDQWSFVHEGLDNSHRVAILEGGMEIEPFKIDNDTAQFLQTREFEVIQMANLFGVPPHKLGAKISTSYNSLESEERAFLNDGLDGWLTAWEEEADVKLLKESQAIRDSHFVEFDRRSLEQADYKDKSESIIQEVNNGIRSENEGRALLNLPSVGPDGDRLRMPINITFVDLVGPQDQQATDEPDPQAEGIPSTDDSEPQGTLPVAASLEPDDVGTQTPQPVRALLASVLTRYAQRLRKASLAASKRADWSTWLESGLDEHRGILCESISPVTQHSQAIAGELLTSLKDELSAVTRDQVETVFDRIDISAWTERVLR